MLSITLVVLCLAACMFAITLGERLPSPEKWADNQVQAASNASDKWLQNTLRPTKDPIAEAKKASGRYATEVQKAIQENRFSKGLDRVNADEMQATIQQVGAAGFAQGVQNRKGKIRAAITRLHSALGPHVAKMDSMPVETEAQREAKVIENLRGMRAIGKQLRG